MRRTLAESSVGCERIGMRKALVLAPAEARTMGLEGDHTPDLSPDCARMTRKPEVIPFARQSGFGTFGNGFKHRACQPTTVFF